MARRLATMDIDEAPAGWAPVCPHCQREIAGIVRQELDEGLGKAYLWMCGHCRKVLGVSHRKGCWMG